MDITYLPPGSTESFLSTQQLPSTSGVLIPLYVYPADVFTNADYNGIIDLARQYPSVPITVALNPGSGPGSVVDGNYTVAIRRLQGAGVRVLGYVHASGTSRALEDVEADVATWLSLYPAIDGLFVDEMTNDDSAPHRAYFAQLTRYAHSRGLYPVVGNPGSIPVDTYWTEECADVIVVYEGVGYPVEATIKGDFDGGLIDVPTNRKAALVYGSTATAAGVRMLIQYAGLVYVTTDTAANPWDTVSTQLSTLLALLLGSSQDVQTFTTAGGTWTKPVGATRVRIVMQGAGGGGGSGRKGLAATVRTGGASGGSGGLTDLTFPASAVPSSLTVVVGAKGAGGAAQATSSTDGNSGAAGAASTVTGTSFFLRVGGGGGGTGGSTGSAPAGTAGVGITQSGIVGAVSSGSGGVGIVGGNSQSTSASGGSGGGITAANAQSGGGASGLFGGSATFAAAGTAGTTGGGSGGNGNAVPAGLSTIGLGGTGGGGGGSNLTGNGGNGGAGAPGAGGGGGGAAVDAVGNSGAGGDGGDGTCVIITSFS